MSEAILNVERELLAKARMQVPVNAAVQTQAAGTIDSLRDALTEALRTYRQLRPQLFDALLELQNTPGGPWKITFKRDPAEGDPTIPPKVQTRATVKADLKLDDWPDVKFLNLAAVVNTPETFAPFHDFAITKDDTPVPPESAAAGVGLRIKVILEAMLKAAKTFASNAHAVREAVREGRITSDARPILSLDERFPFFPYWPRFTADKSVYDAELAKEAPLLDAAELAVALLTGKGEVPSPVPDTPLPASNPFDNVEPHCHLLPEARAALWAACELVLARPGDFAEALAWLDKDFSEAAIRERLLRESEWMCRSALRNLRDEGDRCNTFPRRKALRWPARTFPRTSLGFAAGVLVGVGNGRCVQRCQGVSRTSRKGARLGSATDGSHRPFARASDRRRQGGPAELWRGGRKGLAGQDDGGCLLALAG